MSAYALPASLSACGLLLVALFISAPRYVDPGWRSHVPDMDSDAFFRAQDLNTTREARLADAGVGMAALGVSLGAAVALLGIRRMTDLRHVQTPRAKWKLVALANGTWLGFLPVENHWLFFTAQRGDYPWWADTLAIPLAGNVVLAMFGLPLINAGLLVCLLGSRLPANLWLAPHGMWPWVSSAVIAALGLVVLELAREAVVAGHALQIPLLVSVFYLLLCGRAAAASARSNKRMQLAARGL